MMSNTLAPTPTTEQIAENVERFARVRPQILAELEQTGRGKSGVITNEEFLDAMAEAIRLGFMILADDDCTFCLTERGAEVHNRRILSRIPRG